jgi:GNAT superfamily N-acetyltransferase
VGRAPSLNGGRKFVDLAELLDCAPLLLFLVCENLMQFGGPRAVSKRFQAGGRSVCWEGVLRITLGCSEEWDWIAEAHGVPIGYVWFEVQAQPETPFRPRRPRIYVHHISVAPEARRRGTATALLRYRFHPLAPLRSQAKPHRSLKGWTLRAGLAFCHSNCFTSLLRYLPLESLNLQYRSFAIDAAVSLALTPEAFIARRSIDVAIAHFFNVEVVASLTGFPLRR